MFIDRGDKLDAYPFYTGRRPLPRRPADPESSADFKRMLEQGPTEEQKVIMRGWRKRRW